MIRKLYRSFCTNPIREKYMFLFPGQGAQYVGMTKGVIHLPEVQKLYKIASAVLGFDIHSLCLNGPQAALDETIYCQPTVVLASLAAIEQIKSKSPEMFAGCKAVAGFSVGELTALIFAGALSLEDGLRVVDARAQAMHLACKQSPGAMLSVIGIEENALRTLCSDAETEGHGTVCIANYIFPRGFVVSGTTKSLQYIRNKVGRSRDIIVRPVSVSGAFHSSLMGPAVQRFKDALDKVKFITPCIPVYSNVTGQCYTCPDEIRHNLCAQITHPVLWRQIIHNMHRGQPDARFVEVGPGKQLQAMLKQINLTAYERSKSVGV